METDGSALRRHMFRSKALLANFEANRVESQLLYSARSEVGNTTVPQPPSGPQAPLLDVQEIFPYAGTLLVVEL